MPESLNISFTSASGHWRMIHIACCESAERVIIISEIENKFSTRSIK